MPSSNSINPRTTFSGISSALAIRSGLTPFANRFDDHLVTLNGWQPVDPRVVGETFVVIGDNALSHCFAELFQRDNSQMPIQQQERA